MITGRQIAAARSLVGITQKELADASSISIPTLKRMEASEGEASGMKNNVAAVLQALMDHDIEFINTRDREGVVRKIAPVRAETKVVVDRPAYITQPGHRRVDLR